MSACVSACRLLGRVPPPYAERRARSAARAGVGARVRIWQGARPGGRGRGWRERLPAPACPSLPFCLAPSARARTCGRRSAPAPPLGVFSARHARSGAGAPKGARPARPDRPQGAPKAPRPRRPARTRMRTRTRTRTPPRAARRAAPSIAARAGESTRRSRPSRATPLPSVRVWLLLPRRWPSVAATNCASHSPSRMAQKSARTTGRSECAPPVCIRRSLWWLHTHASTLGATAARSSTCTRPSCGPGQADQGARICRAVVPRRGAAGRPPKEALGRGAGVSARKDMVRERQKVCAGVRARARAPARASASAQRTSAFACFCSLEACSARRASPRATSSRFGRPWGILCHSDSLSPHRGALLRSLLSSLRWPGIESTSPSARLCSSP